MVAMETVARWTATLLRAYALDDADAYDYVTNVRAAADANVDVMIVE